MNSKNLHKHALPVVVLVVAGVVASVGLVSALPGQALTAGTVTSALTARPVSVERTSGMTAQVHFVPSDAAEQSPALVNAQDVANALWLHWALQPR